MTKEIETLPTFLRVEDPILYSDALTRTNLIEVPCSKTSFASLNEANSQLLFTFTGNCYYRLSSPNTGFLIKFRFRTRSAGGNDRTANITLASNFFGYLFNRATLQLGGTIIEEIRFPGIIMDIFYQTEELEFRNHTGMSVGFLPDSSNVVSETIGSRIGTIAGADAAGVITSVNHNDNRGVKYNNDFNEGFSKRKELYNYNVAANNDFREIEMFIPLNRIFGFCEEIDKLMSYVKVDIELNRTATNTNLVYGANNTTMEFGTTDADSGLTNIQLVVESYDIKPTLATRIENIFAKESGIDVSFLRRSCYEIAQIGTETTYTTTITLNRDMGVARYLFCIFKNSINDTQELNYQRCCHCNIQSISATYATNNYPSKDFNEDWTKNHYARFYNEFLNVVRSLGNRNTGLSMTDFRDIFTIYSLDLSAQPLVNSGDPVVISIKRKELPLDDSVLQNPRSIKGYFVVITEAKLNIVCTKDKGAVHRL